jgi:hypothetical protein
MGGELEIEAVIATPPNLSAFSLAIIPTSQPPTLPKSPSLLLSPDSSSPPSALTAWEYSETSWSGDRLHANANIDNIFQ